jgi:hypothetical protein
MADLLDRTATQVRLPGGVVHKREGGQFVPGHGHHYRTRCGMFLTAERGAVLTTRPVGCDDCKTGGRRP